MELEELAAAAAQLAARGELEAARRKWREARRRARAQRDVAKRVEIGLRWAEAEARWGDPATAERLAREQADLARREGLERLFVRAELLLGRQARDRSELEKALTHFALALDQAERGEEPHPEEWLDIGLAFLSVGMAAPAEASYRAALAHTLTGRQTAKALMGLAAALARLERAGEAVETARRALDVAQATGQQDLVPELRTNVMIYLADAGRAAEARPILADLERRGDLPEWWVRQAGAEAARILWECGEPSAAGEWAERALAAGASGYQAALAHYVLWRFKRHLGDEEGAQAEIEAVMHLAAGARDRPEDGHAMVRLLVRLLTALDQPLPLGEGA